MAAHRYVVSLGSNLGNKMAHIEEAFGFFNAAPFSLVSQSRLYSASPWGFDSQNTFVNACVLVETTLEPLDFLAHIQAYEKQKGRSREKVSGQAYADRVIDLDIIACDGLFIQVQELTIPHPAMHTRRFVLVPMVDVAPHWVHPVFKQTTEQLLADCEDENTVSLFFTS